MDLIILIIIIILLFVFFSGNNTTGEHFTVPHATFFRLPNNMPIYEDTLFRDVTTYENDYDATDKPWFAGVPGHKTALQKCMENCDNHCVENGPGGSATCFPRNTNYTY